MRARPPNFAVLALPILIASLDAAVVRLESGVPVGFGLPSVEAATIFNDPESVDTDLYVITVPENARSLTISLQPDDTTFNIARADVDLFVRRGAIPDLDEGGAIVSDHSGETFLPSEMVIVTPESDPPLQAGEYFIALAQFTPGVPAFGTISARINLDDFPPPGDRPPTNPANVITTVAGTDLLFNDDGKPAVGAPLSTFITDIATGPTGEPHFADLQNGMVMKLRDDGAVEVVAGNGSLLPAGIGGDAKAAAIRLPQAIAFSPEGELHILDTLSFLYRVRDGNLEFIARLGVNPTDAGMEFGPDGSLYIALPQLHRVFRLPPEGGAQILAGTGVPGFSGDGGPADQAQLSEPRDVAIDASGNIYIADRRNFRIRRVSPDGIITTVAGNGSDRIQRELSGPALETPLGPMLAIALGPTGELYIYGLVASIQLLTTDGRLETFAPSTGFVSAAGIAVDAAGRAFVSGGLSDVIRRADPNGDVQVVAGGGDYRFSGDGGPATTAHLNRPVGLDIDHNGNLLIVDQFNNRLRRVTPQGIIDTISGDGLERSFGDGGPASAASLFSPNDVVHDRFGNLYISSILSIRKINTEGVIGTAAGLRNVDADDNFAPRHLALDPAGRIYSSDQLNEQVRLLDLDGTMRTIAGTGRRGFSGDGGPAVNAQVNRPAGIALAPDGSVFFTDSRNNRLRRIGIDGVISTVLGGAEQGPPSQGVPANQITLDMPDGILFDSAGALYIADGDNSIVRRLGPDGLVTTVAGSLNREQTSDGAEFPSGDGGPATDAVLVQPADVAIDPAGNLYISDSVQHRVRKVLADAPSFFELSRSDLSLASSSNGPPTRIEAVLARTEVAAMQIQTAVRTDDGGDWLELTSGAGATPRRLEIRANPAGLAPGRYTGEVDAIVPLANPMMRTVRVTFDVGAELPPAPSLGASSLSFTYSTSSTARDESVILSNQGGGMPPFTVAATTTDGANWLSVTPAAGTLSPAEPITLNVLADPAGLVAGSYSGLITVNAAGADLTLPVTMTISESDQVMLIPQRGLSFLSVAEGGVVPPQSFGVLNAGSGDMAWTTSTSTLSGGDWLSATPSGTSNPNRPAPLVEVTVDQSNLEAGAYYGLVEARAPEAPNSPQQIPVFLEVRPAGSDPGAQITPNELIFHSVEGSSPGSQNVFVYGISAGQKTFKAAPNTDLDFVWFATLPNDAELSPDEPTRMLVQPRSNSLPPGVHRGRLPLQFSDGRVSTVYVTLIQAAAAPGASLKSGSPVEQAGCTPQRLLPRARSLGSGFGVSAGWPVGLQVRVVDDCGQDVDRGGVVVEFSNGDPELSLVSLRGGRWDGTWLTSENEIDQVTLRIRAEAEGLEGMSEVTGQLNARLERPDFTREGVVSAADFDRAAPAPPSPGSLISIFGTRLSQGLGVATEFPLPEVLAGTTVLIAGQPAPLLFSSTGQVNAQIPYEIAPNTSHRMLIQRGATLTEAVDISVAPAQPAIFLAGGRQGHIYQPIDGALVLADAARPAGGGDVVIIYAAGLGPVNPPVEPGVPAGSDPLRPTIDPARVRVAGEEMRLLYSGLTPEFVGVYQINAFIPDGLAASTEAPVTVEASGVRSPAVTMAIE